jgi:formate dehydrogenase major subunit
VPQVTRRDFLKISAAGTGAAGLSALGFDLAQAANLKQSFHIAGATESHSVCPYCAVGCSLVAFTTDNGNGGRKLLQIEGNPDSPVNEGRLCPKGATAMQLATSARRVENPLYRAPGSDKWQQITWDDMLTKLAQRVKEARDSTFVAQDATGNTVNRTEGIAFAGGAAFSSEEGYFAAKVMRGLGLVHLEQQARV